MTAFEQWCVEVDHVARDRGYRDSSITQVTGLESWRYYYNANYSPEAALNEMESYE